MHSAFNSFLRVSTSRIDSSCSATTDLYVTGTNWCSGKLERSPAIGSFIRLYCVSIESLHLAWVVGRAVFGKRARTWLTSQVARNGEHRNILSGQDATGSPGFPFSSKLTDGLGDGSAEGIGCCPSADKCHYTLRKKKRPGELQSAWLRFLAGHHSNCRDRPEVKSPALSM